jgi:hypothetical protein
LLASADHRSLSVANGLRRASDAFDCVARPLLQGAVGGTKVMSRVVRHLGIASVFMLLAACSTSGPLHIVVDPSLADGEIYEVSGKSNRHWGQPLTFGDFATKKTRVGETWMWSTGFFDVGAGVRQQPYRFLFLDEAGGEWQVECRAKTPILRHADDHGSWEVPLGETRLGCALRDPAGLVHPLALHGTGLDFAGTSGFGEDGIEIRSLHGIPDRDGREHRFPGVLGYELRQGDRVLGSVDLLGKGRVYLAHDLSAELRAPVAATATVLMFFGEH